MKTPYDPAANTAIFDLSEGRDDGSLSIARRRAPADGCRSYVGLEQAGRASARPAKTDQPTFFVEAV